MSDPRKEKIVTARGVVTEALPSTLFRVKMEDKTESEKEVLVLLKNKVRKNDIIVLISSGSLYGLTASVPRLMEKMFPR